MVLVLLRALHRVLVRCPDWKRRSHCFGGSGIGRDRFGRGQSEHDGDEEPHNLPWNAGPPPSWVLHESATVLRGGAPMFSEDLRPRERWEVLLFHPHSHTCGLPVGPAVLRGQCLFNSFCRCCFLRFFFLYGWTADVYQTSYLP